MTGLLRCCQQAALDGFRPAEHFPVCMARAADPPPEEEPAEATAHVKAELGARQTESERHGTEGTA